MPKSDNIILDQNSIERKIERIAFEILENNYEEKALLLIGIKDNGFRIAQALKDRLSAISKLNVTVAAVTLDKREPMSQPIELSIDPADVKGKAVVIVDDVAQSGKTLLYAIKPLLEHSPARIQVAVLVDRKHKKFPVSADYVGLLLSSGIQEQVIVEMGKETYAYLV